MSTRRGPIADYAGATTRLAPDRGLALDPKRWAFAEKMDGMYCRISTDPAGRISSLLHRSAEPIDRAFVGDLVGLAVGLPDAVLHGEITAGTDAGERERDRFGATRVWLFDCSRAAGQNLERLPYAQRYGRLHQWQATTECLEPQLARNDWWTEDTGRRAHGRDGRFVRPTVRDLRRLPILPLHRGPDAARALWRDIERRGGEGIVACRLAAALGKRGAKAKIKLSHDLDCTVVEVGTTGARLYWAGRAFRVPCRAFVPLLAPGMVVTIRSDGFYDSGVPRFARVTAIRRDLTPSQVAP